MTGYTKSKVFTFTSDYEYCVNAAEVIRGRDWIQLSGWWPASAGRN
mgnify:CR=1 FL=1